MNDFVHRVVQHITQCAAHISTVNNLSPFPILVVKDKNIAFHLIEINIWQHLQCNTDGYFFVRLSQQYQQQGIQLVHLWEDVWRAHTALVEARIAVLLGKFTRYHARQTTVKHIDNPTLKDFLRLHHLQAVIGGRYKYGLFDNGGALLAVAAFSGSCPIDRNGKVYCSYELLRFASQSGCVVAGGLGKLIAHFIAQKHPDDIMSYIDRDWGTGRSLHLLGFECVGTVEPQQFWLDEFYQRHYTMDETDTYNRTVCCNSGSYKFLKIIAI
jgi:hypothetical protein